MTHNEVRNPNLQFSLLVSLSSLFWFPVNSFTLLVHSHSSYCIMYVDKQMIHSIQYIYSCKIYQLLILILLILKYIYYEKITLTYYFNIRY